jgi:O-antigen/teichoic acid export membrane protein
VTTRAHAGLGRSIAVSLVGAAASRGIGAVGGVLAARALGPDGRGQLGLLVVIGTAVATAATGGAQFWIARSAGQSGVASVTRVLARHAAMAAAMVLCVGVVAAPAVRAFTHAGGRAVVAAGALAIVAAANLLAIAVPHGCGAVGVVGAASVVSSAVYLVVAGVALATRTATPAGLVWGAIAGQVTSVGVCVAFVRARGEEGTRLAADAASIGGVLAFGGPAGASELVLFAMRRLDLVVLAAFLPLRDVGLYAVATALADILSVVSDAVALVVLPATAQQPEQSATRRLLGPTLAVMAVAGGGVGAVSGSVIGFLFGTDFADAAVAVPLLMVGALAGGAWQIVNAELVALGRSAPRLWSATAGLLVMIAVDLMAIPTRGILGAALGTACGYVVAAILAAGALIGRRRSTSTKGKRSTWARSRRS